MFTVLIMVLPVVVCFLFGMYLDRQPTRSAPSHSSTDSVADRPGEGQVVEREDDTVETFRPKPAGGLLGGTRAKHADLESKRVEPDVHPTAVGLSIEWTALDQLQLERVLRAAAGPRN